MIKKIHNPFFLIFPVLVFGLYGCSTGSSALPARKKMPEFSSFDGTENSAPFGNHSTLPATQGRYTFLTTNVDLQLGSSKQQFVSIPLPDAASDSAVISLVNSFKPFAIPMLAAWAQQQRRGVIIDLSDHQSGDVHRTDYQLEQSDGPAIPVIVMYDQRSEKRVDLLKNLFQDMPLLKLNCTSCAGSSAN